VLWGLNALLGAPVSAGGLSRLASQLGSDVPFFLRGGTALAAGRGEVLSDLPDAGPWWFVIAKPAFGMSTAVAYQSLDQIESRLPGSATSRVIDALNTGDRALLQGAMGNDFEPVVAASVPEVADLLARLRCRFGTALLCGSGSAVFAIANDAGSAADSVASLRHDVGCRAWCARSVGRNEAKPWL
jgi:4-diphosphocytidyl-2-C-methyl-D-erythritol kinase